MNQLNEDGYEHQFITWLKSMGWEWKFGPDISPDGSAPERNSYKEVILSERLEEALHRINPGLPKDNIRAVVQLLASPGETDLLKTNELIHNWYINGVPQKVRNSEGVESSELVRLIDFENINNFDLLLLTSKNEGMGLVMLEAARLNKASVARNVGGVTEFLENNVNGLTVNGTPKTMAQQITKLSIEEINKLGNAARSEFLKNFTDTRLAKEYFDLYQSLAV